LWDDYHRREVIDINGWQQYEGMPMTMDLNKFMALFDNNYCQINGVLCQIIEVIYNPYYSSGLITYKKKNDYALNKVTIFVVN
jgi:hypothetical protein